MSERTDISFDAALMMAFVQSAKRTGFASNAKAV